MRILHFQCRGQWYKVTEEGHIIRTDIPDFKPSGQWLFLGTSNHHWRMGVDVNLETAFNEPEKLVGGLVWDLDHGTTRTWGGSYNGKLPRVTAAYVR